MPNKSIKNEYIFIKPDVSKIWMFQSLHFDEHAYAQVGIL